MLPFLFLLAPWAPAQAQDLRQLAPDSAPQKIEDAASSLQGPLPVIDPHNPQAALGGTPRTTISLTAQGTTVPPIDEPGLYDLTITDTGTPWIEEFLLYVPGIPAEDRPLLVVFHQGNASHRDVQFNTSYIAEAEARGWYLLAPLGATQINYSSIDSQVNTKLALDFTLDNFLIDSNRIYGVGFSMGAGNALNYAARHLDLDRAVFAAVVNHTGTASLTGTYAADESARKFLDILFDGSPDTRLFEYRRSSILDLDAQSFLASDFNMGLNLAYMPMQSWYATNDPVEYLQEQSETVHSYFQSIGASHELFVIPWIAHNWWILEETTICNWLDAQTLSVPTQGSGIVDRDGAYFHLDLTQTAANAFSLFDWVVEAGTNQFQIVATDNLDRIQIDAPAAGLDTGQELEVAVAAADGQADTIVLAGYLQSPTEVLRDGMATAAWTFDLGTQTVELQETDAGAHTWLIRP